MACKNEWVSADGYCPRCGKNHFYVDGTNAGNVINEKPRQMAGKIMTVKGKNGETMTVEFTAKGPRMVVAPAAESQ